MFSAGLKKIRAYARKRAISKFLVVGQKVPKFASVRKKIAYVRRNTYNICTRMKNKKNVKNEIGLDVLLPKAFLFCSGK